ncbi:MAG: hypothetical protein AB8B91_06135 [Rubripirellula sp.]
MSNTTSNPSSFELPSYEESSVNNCEALLVCLSNRRFVIVHPDEQKDLWPVDGGWEKVRQLKPGDEVIYKGDQAIVRAVDVYR